MKGPIGNLHVRLESGDRGVRTDANGQFALDSVPDGRQVVVFDGSGYPVRRDTLVLQPETGLRGAIVLTPDRDVLQRCPLYNP